MSDPIPRLNAALEGRYRIERELGAGGMAVVYLAHDLKHGREVAIKVLRPELSAVVGAERFVSEIRTTANLKHPHILPLFDSGEADGFLFYVMPYVEGESLRNRLQRESQLGVDEAVRIATKVASALDHAHRHGVVHRDIKPANILLQDGEPLVADFGIALALGAAGGGRLTETGLSLGTPSYMSPEQATGEQPLDARSDVYSLACVLYEMLAGVTPYGEGTPQAILARIVTKDVEPVRRHRRLVPANVDGAIRKALERAPADRFEGAQNFARALADPSFRYGEELVATGSRPWILAAVGLAGALVALAGSQVWGPGQSAVLRRPVVMRMPGVAPNHVPLGEVEIGPMGTGVWYEGPAATEWYRRWDEPEGRPVPGAAVGTNGSAWIMPDGRDIVESLNTGVIQRINLETGETTSREIDGGEAYPSDDGYIYLQSPDKAVQRLPETLQGEPERVGPDVREGERHLFFDVLPGERNAVYQVWARDSSWIEGYSLETGQRRVLTRGMSPHFTSTGHLLFGSASGQIMAARLDPKTLEMGEAAPVVEGPVALYGNTLLQFRIATDGTLAYWEAPAPDSVEMVWVTRSGVPTLVDPRWRFALWDRGRPPTWALSPDASEIAVTMTNGDNLDIWIKELPAGPFTPIQDSPADDFAPTWLGSDTILYVSQLRGSRVVRRPSSGAGQPEIVYAATGDLADAAISPDRERLLLTGRNLVGEIQQVRLGIDSTAIPILTSNGRVEAYLAPSFSPDGSLLAYVSGELGGDVFVGPFPDVSSDRARVSLDGGWGPIWSPDGTEIFYVTPDRVAMAAHVETDPELRITERRRLFRLADSYVFTETPRGYWSVAADGRFLMMRRRPVDDPPDFVVIQNFFTELERLVPR